MPFHPVLEAFCGILEVMGTGASTANQHAPHFADDRWGRVVQLPRWPRSVEPVQTTASDQLRNQLQERQYNCEPSARTHAYKVFISRIRPRRIRLKDRKLFQKDRSVGIMGGGWGPHCT